MGEDVFVVACLCLGMVGAVIALGFVGAQVPRVRRTAQALDAWDAWKRALNAPAARAKQQEAQAALRHVHAAVQAVCPAAVTDLVGSMKSGGFQVAFSDTDIKVRAPTACLADIGAALHAEGFDKVHSSAQYTLYCRGAVDVSVSDLAASDSVHCVNSDPVTLEALGFLTHVAKQQYPHQHVAVRQWRPK